MPTDLAACPATKFTAGPPADSSAAIARYSEAVIAPHSDLDNAIGSKAAVDVQAGSDAAAK